MPAEIMERTISDITPCKIGPPVVLPHMTARIPAGFIAPADDHRSEPLDLNDLVIRHPTATYFVRVEGNSMIGAHICDGDTLVVDRSLEPRNGDIVIAALNGIHTVKRLRLIGQNGQRRILLEAANPAYRSVQIENEADLVIWGVVTHVLHAFR